MSFDVMVSAIQEIHNRHHFRENGGEDPVFRIALLAEELGELAAAVTKDGGDAGEECADVLIALLGTAVSLQIDLESEFWTKLDSLSHRTTTKRSGRLRLIKEYNND